MDGKNFFRQIMYDYLENWNQTLEFFSIKFNQKFKKKYDLKLNKDKT